MNVAYIEFILEFENKEVPVFSVPIPEEVEEIVEEVVEEEVVEEEEPVVEEIVEEVVEEEEVFEPLSDDAIEEAKSAAPKLDNTGDVAIGPWKPAW